MDESNQQPPVEEPYNSANSITATAHKIGLGAVSMHVWQACCVKHGFGGTEKANKMYLKIMKLIVSEFSEGSADGFEAFYAAYPRKVARPAALRAWKNKKINEYLARRIMEALEAAKRSEQWQKDKGKFIPYPATWLNQERWNDEVELPGNQFLKDKYAGLE